MQFPTNQATSLAAELDLIKRQCLKNKFALLSFKPKVILSYQSSCLFTPSIRQELVGMVYSTNWCGLTSSAIIMKLTEE